MQPLRTSTGCTRFAKKRRPSSSSRREAQQLGPALGDVLRPTRGSSCSRRPRCRRSTSPPSWKTPPARSAERPAQQLGLRRLLVQVAQRDLVVPAQLAARRRRRSGTGRPCASRGSASRRSVSTSTGCTLRTKRRVRLGVVRLARRGRRRAASPAPDTHAPRLCVMLVGAARRSRCSRRRSTA